VSKSANNYNGGLAFRSKFILRLWSAKFILRPLAFRSKFILRLWSAKFILRPLAFRSKFASVDNDPYQKMYLTQTKNAILSIAINCAFKIFKPCYFACFFGMPVILRVF